MPAAPPVGDLVEFSDGRRWQIRGSQFVRPRTAGKPLRELFVCAPAV